MNELPASILAMIPADARSVVDRWWDGLTDAERRTTSEQWDERRESYLFTPQTDEAGIPDLWEQVPVVIGGRFVPHDDSVRVNEWLDDWLEYLSGHEEVILLPRVVVLFRTFHICQTQTAARTVVAAGCLPAEFQCPLHSVECPMRRVQVVAPKRALNLTPATSGGWWVVAPWVSANLSTNS